MGVFDSVGETLFGGAERAPNLFLSSGLGGATSSLLTKRVRTDPLEDPRLLRFLDATMAQIDREFEATIKSFESTRKKRSAGDVLKFRRDLAIAKSEARERASTNLILGLDQARFEGVFQFLSGAQGAETAGAALLEQGRQANVASTMKLGQTFLTAGNVGGFGLGP